ncbi:LmbE-like protein [Linnemannia elongata AG-77]|uniref:N-acetylglucosaminylphosphatidylinositol deacetylase n=1 Tax=Linnemannia elongata AG-77 TaxID=1314771 RepID=A0A197JCN9_9FUNG|nr:LmbE-like protein [Linnemannia elongata AG-77]
MPGSILVTVFAGIPPCGTPAPSWDQSAGFVTADEAVRARREEDRHAVSILGAQAVWLDFLDDQYNVSCTADAIAARLVAVLETYSDVGVVAPFGLSHSDHILVHDAALKLFQREKDQRPWFFYEEALYRRDIHRVAERRSNWHAQGLLARRVNLLDVSAGAEAKAMATRAYTSQIALFKAELLSDLHAPESYWQLQCETAPLPTYSMTGDRVESLV